MISPSISIGPLTLHLYGLIIALSIYFGWLLAKKRANFYKIPQKLFDDPVLVLPLALSVIAARLYHVLDYWDYYTQNPQLIIKISQGGLGIWGGLIGAFIGIWLIAKIKKLNLLSLLDLAAPSLLLGQAIGRFGNYINQEGFDPPTTLPWGVYISYQNRPAQFLNSDRFHPTFFYEAAIDAAFVFILLKLSKRFKKPGSTFAVYLILYSIGRFTIEFFRIDTATIGTIKVAQVLSAIAFIVGVLMLLSKKNRG